MLSAGARFRSSSCSRMRETRDELGLGAIRDAFAEALFPGISTFQRRARYFLFVPWMFRAAEQRCAGDRLGEHAQSGARADRAFSLKRRQRRRHRASRGHSV